jgi:hypothetical protein
MFKKLPSESTFLRALGEFAQTGLAGRAHEARVKETLGGNGIGHLGRDATAIEAREPPLPQTPSERPRRSIHCQCEQKRAESFSEIPTAGS